MKGRYRVGTMYYLWQSENFVVQKHRWFGWETVAAYYSHEAAIRHGKQLRDAGNEVSEVEILGVCYLPSKYFTNFVL